MTRALVLLLALLCVLAACSVAPSPPERTGTTRQALEWTFEASLAQDYQASQGNAVALSGDTLVVGSFRVDQSRGAADVYRRGADGAWSHEAQLRPPFDALSSFGVYVAISGDRIVVSSYSGFFVYERLGRTWTLAQVLSPPVTPGKNAPQPAAAIAGDVIVVESPQFVDPFSADPSAAGALVVYERDEMTGAFLGTPMSLPEAHDDPSDGKIAIDGGMFVYANGHHLLLYRRVARGDWRLEATLDPVDPKASVFGFTVALHGDDLLVGSFDGNAVEVFRRSGTQWMHVTTIAPASTASRSSFGFQVVFSGDEGVVGDPDHDRSGAIYRIRRRDGAWRLAEQIAAPKLVDGSLGLVLAMDGDTVAAGVRQLPYGGALTFRLARGLGETCDRASACGSGHCVDGVCCDEPCGDGRAADCASCALPGKMGHCSIALADTLCRASLGECDIEERCSGTTIECGPDQTVPDGTSCAGGRCSAGACRGEPIIEGGAPAAGPATPPSIEGGGCSFAPRRSGPGAFAAGFSLLGVLLLRRRHRTLTLVALGLALLPRAPVELIAGRLHARIDARTTTLHDEATGERWTMGLEAIRRGDVRRTLSTSGVVEHDGRRATVGRGDVDEWFEVNEKGIEHGAVLRTREGGSGALHLEVHVASERAERPLQSVTDGARLGALAYSNLEVRDAKGQTLPASMSLRDDQTIDIAIDDANAAYPLVVDPQVWLEQQRIDPPEELPPGSFGISIATRGERLFVTRYGAGACVYVYRRDAHQWIFEAVLRPDHDETDGGFGITMALGDDIAVIGAPFAHQREGELFVFERDPATNTWKETADIREPEPTGFDLFSYSIALAVTSDSYVILAGAPGYDAIDIEYSYGLVEVFSRSRAGGQWHREAPILGGEDERFFGQSIAIDGEHLAISSVVPGVVLPSLVPAAVHFYEGPPNAWTEIQVERSSTVLAYALYGFSLALHGDTIAIGYPALVGAFTTPGSIWIYELRDGVWEFSQKLGREVTARDETLEDVFGSQVLLEDRRLLTFGYREETVAANGYLFERGADGRFRQTHAFEPPTRSELASFASGLALAGDQVLIGSPDYDGAVGAVRVYTLAELGQACSANGACASGHCIDGVCCDSACNDGDLNDCLACSVAMGASQDGTCTPVAALHVCRPARSDCDVVESCDGTSERCPVDVIALNGAPCAKGTCGGGTCQPTVAAPSPMVDAGAPLASAPPSAETSCSLGPRGGSRAGLGLLIVALLALRRRRG